MSTMPSDSLGSQLGWQPHEPQFTYTYILFGEFLELLQLE